MPCRKPLVQWLRETWALSYFLAPGAQLARKPGAAPPESLAVRAGHLQGQPRALSERGPGLAPGKGCGFYGCLDNPAYSRPDLGWVTPVNIDRGPRQRGIRKQGMFYL